MSERHARLMLHSSEYLALMVEQLEARAEAAEREAKAAREEISERGRTITRYAATLAAVRKILADDAQSFYEARRRILAILDGEAKSTERKPGPLHG